MRHGIISAAKVTLALLFAAFLSSCTTTENLEQTAPSRELAFDGLHRVDNIGKLKVWVKPNVSLAQYAKIMLIQTGIQYRPVHSNSANDTEFELSDEKKERLGKILQQSFSDQLQKTQQFSLTDKPGPEVITLKAGLIDVVSNVPEDELNFKRVFIRTIGSATLVIELHDSISGEMLVRATERRSAEVSGGELRRSSAAINFAEIKRDAKRWATSLSKALDELKHI